MKKLFCIFTVLALLLLASPPVYAASAENEENEEIYSELIESSGADRLFGKLSEEARDTLNENGIDGVDTEDIMSLSFSGIMKTVGRSITSAVKTPLAAMLSCIGIILLCSLLNSLKSTFQSESHEQLFSAVSIICTSAVIIAPIASIISVTSRLIEQMSDFLLSFVPVYAGIITTSGQPISAAAYSAAVISAAQVISRLSCTVLTPMLSAYLAFCLIGSVSDKINMSGITRTVKTVVITALSFSLTIFTGILALKSVVATAADGVAMKTAKFAANAFLPVVGAAISEALNSIQGCVGVIKSSVGAFGIIAVAAMLLPSLISIILMQLSLSISIGVSDCLQTENISRLLSCARSVMSLILGILIVFAALILISSGLMLSIGK